MLNTICAEIRNYFLAHKEKDIHAGKYTITNGSINLSFLLDGQYFRIVGSALNDGVYQYPASCLKDEQFEGSVLLECQKICGISHKHISQSNTVLHDLCGAFCIC